jgi:RHS repeat-associated protein
LTSFARAQEPLCEDSCNGGPQTPGTGGGPIQAQASVSSQRGIGGPGVTALPAGKSTNIEGSESYTYAVPLFSIPGRGLNLNLALYYNSLVWQFNSDGNAMRFASDFDTPAPGFRVGFGLVDFSSDHSVGILTEPTGAKHLLVQNGFPSFHTTDSTYIQVQYPTVAGGPVIATFKDGVKSFYQPFTVPATSHTLYRPYQIEDTNGNIISITYANANDLNIDTITDTVGRIIQFTYDANGKLQSIRQLDSGGQIFRQYTFAWETRPLNFSFTRLVTSGPGPIQQTIMTSGQTQVNLLSKVTRPDGTSVAFDNGFGTGGNPDWGIAKTITELSSSGAFRSSISYVFPTASAGALVTNPTYTQQIVNDGVNTKNWSYQANKNGAGLVTSFVTTDPCGNTLTTTFSSAGDAIDGMPIKEEMANTQPAPAGCPTNPAQTWRTVNKTWTTDADGSNPRLLTLSTVLQDGTTQSLTKSNTYDAFGQVTDLLQYDFGANAPGPLLKEVVTTYASPGNGIADRPSRVTVKDGAGNIVSRNDYNYDDYSVVTIANISPNPAGHDPAFTSSSTVRGNLTSMISYTNAAAATGGITSTFAYDSAGNRVTSKLGCCTFSQHNFSSTTQYAYPDSVGSGPVGNALSLTASYTYNLLTGTLASATDVTGQTTRYTYDTNDRLITKTLPDGSATSQSYDDSAASPSTTVSNSFNSREEVTTTTGPTITEQTKNGSSLISTKTVTSDLLGHTISVSNPFGPGETPLYMAYAYDPLGRVTQVTPPGNAGSYQTSYGIESTSIDPTVHMVQTVITTDPAGKQRKQYTDGQGLRQVDEPGPTGGQAGSGSASITGTEQSASVPNGGGATAGTGTVTLSGTERSTVVVTHVATPASVVVTIGGSDGTITHVSTICPPRGTCHTITSHVADSGTIQFSVSAGGIDIGPISASYGSSSTSATLAAALAGSFPSNAAVTISYASGSSSFTLATRAQNAAANSSTLSTSLVSSCVPFDGDLASTICSQGWTITPTQNFAGGTDTVNTTFYDTGTTTVNVTINGTVYSKSSTYGQNTTNAGMASDLASKINSDTTLNQLLVAGSSGGVLSLTTTATGGNTADPLSVSSVTNSQYFTAGSTSFPATPSGATLTPGQNGVVFDAGTVKVSITGFTADAYAKTVNYGQGSTSTSIASGLAAAFNADPLAPVTASASNGVISLTARTLGADTNYGVAVTSTTTQPTYFTQPSFSGSAISLSGGQDSSASLQTPLSTTYFYDALGRLLRVNQGAQQRVYQYDDLGHVISSKIPETLNQATTFTYTDFGGVYQKTDPRGTVTTNAYDALARLTQVTYSDMTPSVTYSYGAPGAPNFGAGRVTQIVDGSGTRTFQYDQMGRTKQVSRTIGTQTYPTSYAYTNEQLSTMTYPSGRTVTMTPDAMGRISQVGSNGNNLLTIGSYNAAGEVLGQTYGNSMVASYTYNNQLQLATLVSGSVSTPVLNLTYNYGANDNGQIQSITDGINPSLSTSYSYDELGRLKTAQTNDLAASNTWKLKFSYDRYGNRLSEVPAAGTASMPFSEITIDSPSNRINGVQYDNAGNITSDGLHSYTYNAENKIVQVDGAGSFLYDSEGHRVQKNGAIYIYEGSQVIAEYPSGAAPGSPSVEYLGKLASFAGGITTYYYSDQLSIRALADGSGNVVGRLTQYPFGELLPGLQTGTTTKWQFTTYERDLAPGDSGLDYAQARFYTSRLGRFTSLDPLTGTTGNPQSLNRYAYAGNDPINSIDPSGMLHGRLGCLLDNFGNCVGGNGYVPGQGGWGDAQLLTNDSRSIFSDPFGPWVDPTKWDPLAEGEARFDSIIHSWGNYDPATGKYLATISVYGYYELPDGTRGLIETDPRAGLTPDQLATMDAEMKVLVDGLHDGSIILGLPISYFTPPGDDPQRCNICHTQLPKSDPSKPQCSRGCHPEQPISTFADRYPSQCKELSIMGLGLGFATPPGAVTGAAAWAAWGAARVIGVVGIFACGSTYVANPNKIQ